MFDPERYIDITKCNLKKLVQAAYDLSEPRGMGTMHFDPKPLTDKEAQDIINVRGNQIPHKDGNGSIDIISLDYVKGRCVKMTVFRDKNGVVYIRKDWYDHNAADLDTLLARCGYNKEAV